MHDTKIVIGGVSELWTTRTIAHRPNVGRGRLQSLVHPDIAMLVELDSGLLKSDPIRVRRPARSEEEIGTFDNSLALSVLGMDPYALGGTPLDPTGFGTEQHLDSFIVKQLEKGCADVGILTAGELRALFDHGHLRAETPHTPRQFQADVAAAHHHEARRQSAEIERLDMGHRSHRGEPRHRRSRCPRT